MVKALFVATLAAAAAPAALATAADRIEERLRAAAQADAAGYDVALLERLVMRNSGTLDGPGVKAVAELVRAELEPLGFQVRWVDMAAAGRSGHLVATHPGRGRGKRVLLIGHLDTVFEPTSPFQRFVRDGDRATGPGVIDDKGGLVVIVSALRAMKAAGALDHAAISVVLTGDEERPGQPTALARADLIGAGRQSDAALEFEPVAYEAGREYATIARRSGSAWELVAHGRSGHSAGVFGAGLGYGAIYELARILDRFRRELIEPDATFNVGLVAGGTPASIGADGATAAAAGKTNVVAADAVARGDLRTLTPEQDARLREGMARVVADHLPGTTATLEFYDTTPPVASSAGSRALLAELNAANRALGLPEMAEYDPLKRGAADSGFVAQDVAVLGGMGASGGGTHGEGEWIDLPSIPRQALRAAALITRLTREKRR